MRTLLAFYVIVIFVSCSRSSGSNEAQKQPKINYGNNIVLLSDLSNRVLHPKSIHDTTIIFSIIDKLKPLIEKSVELNIDDRFKFYSINQYCIDRIPQSEKNMNFHIDMSEFKKNELNISNYLYGRVEKDFNYDISSIKSSIKYVYDFNYKSDILGADVWHYFNDQIGSSIIDTSSTITAFKNNNYLNKKRNKLILLTDGYIEAGRYAEDKTMIDKNNPNKTKYLSSSLIKKFRDEFNNSSFKNIEDFFEEGKYGLIPFKNPLLSDVDILVLEIDDRTIVNGLTTVFPTDSEIIKLFWSKWISESGLDTSRFQIHNRFHNTRELESIVSNFLDN